MIDGPLRCHELWSVFVAPLNADGRSPIRIGSQPRQAQYGEADLKVQWFCVKSDLIKAGPTVVWHTIDTDSLCQCILSRLELDAKKRRVVIEYPPMGKGKAATLVDTSRLPRGNATALAFALLLPGCDYSDSALGFGLDPAQVLLADGAALHTPMNSTTLGWRSVAMSCVP